MEVWAAIIILIAAIISFGAVLIKVWQDRKSDKKKSENKSKTTELKILKQENTNRTQLEIQKLKIIEEGIKFLNRHFPRQEEEEEIVEYEEEIEEKF